MPPHHTQFGNNFYLLFLATRKPEEYPVLVEVYLRRAEEFGKAWKTFLGDSEQLLQDLDGALDGTKSYNDLFNYYIQLLKENRNEEADKLDLAAGYPAGIEGIGMFAWDKINPLLQQAADRMRALGIEPEEFYG